ncbi:MAG: autotransporter-associated beta strand repeat-containing protein [Planctomycetota bacterium]|nr:autotransporter-associated beta strand repeat-containing protein [Planctomycetota bacterium]
MRFFEPQQPRFAVFLLVIFQFSIAPNLFGQNYYWDPDTDNTDNTTLGVNLGGGGTWDTSTVNWWDTSANDAWPNNNTANAIFTYAFPIGPLFTPTPNTVTVATGGVTANRLSFHRSGYTLTGDAITLAGTNSGLNAQMFETATIGNIISGSNGLLKTGSGSIRLTNGSNDYTGTTSIQGGSIIISSELALGGTGAVNITSGNNVPLNNTLYGFAGGSLVLDGTAAGFTFSRNINFEGRGPLGDRGSAILSLGNNTLSGTVSSAVSPLPLSPTATIRNSRINSVNGTLTLSGTVNAGGTSATTFLNFGGVNSAGSGNFDLTGVLTGTGSIEKSGGGTLFLNPSSTSGFSGTVRTSASGTGQESTTRVTQLTVGGTSIFGANVGTNASSAIDMGGGVLEFRREGSLDFNSLTSGKNVYQRSTGAMFAGPGVGGEGINGTVTLGTYRVASNTTATFNSRNGYGFTLGAWTQENSNNNFSVANGVGGTLLFTGDAWNNSDADPRNLTFSGNGNTRIAGSILATLGTGNGKQVIKQGTGELILNGTGGTFTGATIVEGGSLRITDFRSINNNTLAIRLGNAGTTAGNLIIGGTGAGTGTVAGLTTSKPILFNSTTGQSAIYANQAGANPVILNGAITTVLTTGNYNFGGSNTADNIINVALPAATTPTASQGGLTKVGAGTWVLNAANLFTGGTSIQGGTLKLRATGTASNVILETATNVITFGAQATAQTAGGTLEFRGAATGATTETLGALTPTAGAGTVRLLGQGGFASNLTFTSLGATATASSLNFDTSGALGGAVTLTGQVATTATNLPGTASFQGHLYINGADFATTTAAGVVQAPTYVAAGPIFSNASTALVGSVHNKMTGSFTNGAATVSSLVTNNQTLTLSGNLVVSTGGILQSGGTASILSDSATSRLIQGGAAGTNVAIRVNLDTDVLNLGSAANPVNISSTTTAGLTKNGAGELVVFGTNAQTGTTTINEGTVELNGTNARLAALAGTNTVVRQNAFLEFNTGVAYAANPTVGTLDGAGTVRNVGAANVTFVQTGAGTWAGSFNQTGAGTLSVSKLGTTGAPIWQGVSNYTGVTTIGGTTGSVTVDVLANGGVNSGIGASSNAASNLVFSGTTAGIDYRGSIIDNALTLGSRSASTDRLFTLAAAATGATLSSSVSNNNAIVWSNTGAIVNNTTANATLTFAGASTGDNTFNPQLVDSSVGGGVTLGVTKSGAGQWNLGNANNSYTGITTVGDGILGLNSTNALPANSPLVLGAAATSGVLQTSGTFARNLTTTPTAGTGTITWGGTTGGGGFAAHTTPLTVTLNSGAGLTWGSGGFVPTGAPLVFGSASALSDVTFTNAIDLGAAVRTITVNANTNTGTDFATLSGVLSGTGGGLLKNGAAPLRLTGANTYTGTTNVEAGTIVVSSLGRSSAPGVATSVGLSSATMDNSNAIVLGNATTTGGLLQYVGAGETSDRKIRLRGTSASNQIHADGSGPLILSNVAHDTTETGDKTLFLRGSNTAGNMITSPLTNNVAGVLSVTVDGGATWILTNSGNTYTGNTTVGGGALGIGGSGVIGTGTVVFDNGTMFAYGADRTITNAVSLNNDRTAAFIGDNSLTFTQPLNWRAAGNNSILSNSVAAGKSVTFNGGVTNTEMTANRAWTIDGTGETVINGNFTTTTAFGVRFDVNGGGTLTLGTNGATSDWNKAGIAAVDVDRGTLKFSANNAIPTTSAAFAGVILSPELATADTATLDLNGTNQTINAFTVAATSDGAVVIDNTSANPATLTFGANNTVVNITNTGARTITDSGTGALSIVKTGNTALSLPSGMTITHQGSTSSTGGGSFTINSAVNGTTGLVASGSSTLALPGGLTAPSVVTSITVGGSSTLNLLDGTGSAFSDLTSLSLGAGSGTASLSLNVGDLVTAGDFLNTDSLTLLTGGTLSLNNTVTFNMTDTGLNPLTTYTLLNLVDGGITAFGTGNMIQGTTPGGFTGFTWNVTDNLVQITTGNLITGDLFWRGAAGGGTDTTWNGDANNWSLNKANSSVATSTPGSGTNVVFAIDSATGAVSTTLGQNFKINALTFEAGASTPISVTIASGVGSSRLEVRDGVAITAGGPAAVTISAPFRLGADQTWNVADTIATLTLSGGLQGEKDVIKIGGGKVIISAPADIAFNAGLTSDFTVNSGNLEITSVDALGVAGKRANVAVNTGGAFYYNAAAGTVANNLTLGGGTLSAGTANQIYSGTVNVSGNSFINMADQNGPVANTARSITLSGVVSGSGNLTVNSSNAVTSGNQISGTLTFSNAGNTWSGDLIIERGSATFGTAASPAFTANNVRFNTFGKVAFQNTNGSALTRTGTLTYAAGALGEFSADNVSGTLGANYLVNQNGVTTLGAGGTGATMRVFLADTASAVNMGDVTLGGTSSISVAGGDADSFTTISGIISDGGNIYGLNINDDVGGAGWGQANTILRLTGANTFTGNVALTEGTLEFDTVTDAGGGASALGNGTTLSVGAATLRFIGSSPQSTNRAITQTGAATYGTNGATVADSITYNGAINAGANNFTLTGLAGRIGLINGGITQTGGSVDGTVNGGTWAFSNTTTVVADDLNVTGASTILNLNGAGILSFNTASPSADSSLRVNGGATVNLGASNAIVTTEFDGLRVGTDAAGVGTLNLGAFNQTANEFLLGNRNLDRSGIINGSGTLTVTGNFDMYGGTVNANLASTGTQTLDKLSLNTVTLSGDNSGLSATGSTVITEGTLVLDYTASNTTKIRSASTLDMRGGNLSLSGNAGAATSQSVGSFTLGSGGSSRITLNPAGQNLVLNLNAITRAVNAQDGTIRFTLPSGTQNATNGITTDSLNTIGTGANAILGAWATVNDGSGTFFARNVTNLADGNIGAAATTSQDTIASWITGDNVSDSAGFSGTVNSSFINSLRLNAASGSNISLGTSGVLGLSSGGILVTNNVSGTPRILGGTLFSGTVAATPELIITQDSASTFEIGADIRTNHQVFKTGSGTLLLSGNNVYTGLTEIQEGNVQVSGGNGIGDTSLVTLAAGRASGLQLLSNETIGRLAGGSSQTDQLLGTVAVGSNTLSINQSGNTAFSGLFTGNGTIVMNTGSTGTLNMSNASSGFTGSVVVNGGMFQLSGIGRNDASAITINGQGGLLIDKNGTTTSSTQILDTASITLNSAVGGNQAAPSGLWLRRDQGSTLSETVGVVTANSGTSYVRLEQTATSAITVLTAENVVRNNSATIVIRGSNMANTTDRRAQFRIATANETAFNGSMIGGGGAAGTVTTSIVPWAIGEDVANVTFNPTFMGNSLVTYTGTTGFRPLNLTTEYGNYATAGATNNTRESLAANLSGLAGRTVNSLVLNNINAGAVDIAVTGTGAAQTLAVTSGAMLFTRSNPATTATAQTITLGGFDSGITVGASNEYVISVVNPDASDATKSLTATISSPLTSIADITKSGRGTLILNQTNTAGGGARVTSLNEGVLQIANLGNIGGSTGGLRFAGGTLRMDTSFDISTRTISILNGGAILDTNGNSPTLAGSLGSGVGGFTKIGAGNLTLNGSATYTGPTTLTTGTITVGANNALGNGGDLNIGGGTTLAFSASNSLTHGLVTTSGASPLITGTGTINASSGFLLNHTGDTTIAATLAGASGLTKAQSNTVTLSGLNTYTGTTEIQAGTLSINSISNVAGGASAVGSASNVENGIIRMGLTTAATTLNYTGSGHSSDRLIGMQGTTGGVTIDADGTGALGLGGARFENVGNKTLTLRGSSIATLNNTIGALNENGGVLTVNKTDANTWLVNGASTYTGATQIDNGTLKVGLNNALSTTTAVRLGTGTTAGTLDLNGFNQTIGSLTSQTTSNSVINNIIVGSSKVLTINGGVTLGADAANSDTNVSATGGGSIVVNSSGANFQVGGATGGTNANRADVDFSGLTNFTANLGSGTFRVGDAGTQSGVLQLSTFRMATNNTLTAANVRIGDGTGNGGETHLLVLGSGTNSINTDTLNIGSAAAQIRTGGSINFDGADTTGTLNLRASNGTGRTTINMINTTGATAADMVSIMNLTGHTSDLLFSTATLATRSASTGAATATLSFDQGNLDITTLNIASRTGTGTGNATGTVNLGDSVDPGTPTTMIGTINMAVNTSAGGTVLGDLNITGGNVNVGTGAGTAINMANAGTFRTVTSTIDLTGGITTVTGNIIRTGGAGTENATITVNGGTLDMAGNSIGGAAAAISLVAQSGTLQNLGQLNGGGNLVKTTTGTLILGGINTYTGQTNIDTGTLQINGSTAAASTVNVATAGTLTGAGTVGGNATLTGNGIINISNLGNIGGSLDVTGGNWNGSGSVAGAVTASSGTFTIGAGANLTANGNLDVTGGSIASGNSASTITGSVNYTSASSSTFGGLIAGSGKTVTVNNGSATLTLSGTNTYTGTTTISGGTLQLGNGGTTGSLSTSSEIFNNANLTINRSNVVVQGTDFSGAAITGTGSLTQAGSGTTTLNAVNTYSGGTTVSDGTLVVNTTGSGTDSGTGSGAVSVQSGATLAGSGRITGMVTFTSGATHDPGTSPGVQTLAGGAEYKTGSILNWELIANTELGRGTDFDGINVMGSLTIESGVTSNLKFNSSGSTVSWADSFWDSSRTWLVFSNSTAPGVTGGIFSTINVGNDFGGNTLLASRGVFSWATDSNNIVLNYTAVPEPTSLVFGIGLGVAGLIAARRRRLKVNAAAKPTV